MLNPFFQYTYHCLKERLLRPRSDLPSTSVITGGLSAPPAVQTQAHSSLDDVKRLFKLEPISSKPDEGKRWKDAERLVVLDEDPSEVTW